MAKTVLLASFIFPERLEWFLEYLKINFNIDRNHVFGYKCSNDNSKIIITFKLSISSNKTINFKEHFPSVVQIHKRGNCLYSINALNKLISDTLGDNLGNINYKSINVDWSKYQNKLILTNNNILTILPIKRLF